MPEDIDNPVTDVEEVEGVQDKPDYSKSDIEILSDDKVKEKEKPPESEEEKKPKEKEVEEEEVEEEEEEEEEEEVEEDDVPLPSPEYREVIKKYPQLFKDFPGLRHDFFRVKAFDKIFTSVDEAREIAQQYDGYLELGKTLENGDSEALLTNLAKYSKASMSRLTENFLPALYKVDPQIHNRLLGNSMANVLRLAQTQAKSSGNKNLYHAAAHLSMFLWDKETVPEAAPQTSPEIEEQKKLLEQRENEFFNARHTEFVTDVKDTGEKLLRKEVARGLDPDGVIPDVVKETILDRVLKDVDSAMSEDEQHVRNMNALWERAARQGHNKDFKARLIQTYVNRARSLVGPIRRKLVNDTIAKMSKKTDGASGKTTSKKEVPGGKATGTGGKTPSPKEVDWSHTSDLDYMNRNITKRK